MQILIDDNDFLIAQQIKQLKTAINGADFEEVYKTRIGGTGAVYYRDVYNKTEKSFNFDYWNISGTVNNNNGRAELSNKFSFIVNGNIFFNFEVMEG